MSWEAVGCRSWRSRAGGGPGGCLRGGGSGRGGVGTCGARRWCVQPRGVRYPARCRALFPSTRASGMIGSMPRTNSRPQLSCEREPRSVRTARVQSIRSAAFSAAGSSRWMAVRTPACCQSRNLHQQVRPQDPCYCVRDSYGGTCAAARIRRSSSPSSGLRIRSDWYHTVPPHSLRESTTAWGTNINSQSVERTTVVGA